MEGGGGVTQDQTPPNQIDCMAKKIGIVNQDKKYCMSFFFFFNWTNVQKSILVYFKSPTLLSVEYTHVQIYENLVHFKWNVDGFKNKK